MSPMAACKCSAPAVSSHGLIPERWSPRLEDRRRASLGPFQALPCEIIQHILSFTPVRSLSQLAQVSTGWHWFLLGWLQLRSSAWIVAPGRRHVYSSDSFYKEYSELGLLCRRVFNTASMPDRAHAFWRIVHRVERASIVHYPGGRYEPTFVGASNFFRAALPLSCCRSQAEKFETVWQVVRDAAGVDQTVLEGAPGSQPSQETDLRLVLRVLFVSPAAPSSNVRLARQNRGAMLRTLLYKLDAPRQARALFVCYGPRSGSSIEWNRPCDSTFSSLTQMLHVVSELAAAVLVLSQNSTPAFIYSLVQSLIRTPSIWLPRYQVMLLLLMGSRAAASFLAGILTNAAPHEALTATNHIANRLAQMLSLSQLYKAKLVLSDQYVSEPVYTAATANILQVLINFFQIVPATNCPVNLIDQIFIRAMNIAHDVGGNDFAGKMIPSLRLIYDYFTEKSQY